MSKLKEIFEHQHHLATKYNPIERQLGFSAPTELPMVLNSYHGQDRLRMFYAYICEELAEAKSAAHDQKLYQEELSDVLHFATEFCLIAGIPPEYIEERMELTQQLDLFDPFPRSYPDIPVIQQLWGRAINLLKFKRWKQTPKHTDEVEFAFHVSLAYTALLRHIEIYELDFHQIYMAKHKKNEERISTGY